MRGAVLFDIDGTLLVGSSAHLRILAETLAARIGRKVEIEVERERPLLDGMDISGWIDAQVVRAVLSRTSDHAVAEADVAQVMTAYERAFIVAMTASASAGTPVEGAAACLGRLRDAGVRLGLVTGNASPVARNKLAAAGLDQFFTFDPDLGFGDWRRDRVAIAVAALRAVVDADGDASGVSIVGDTQADMMAARTAGASPIGVETGASRAGELLAAGAATVVRSIASIVPST